MPILVQWKWQKKTESFLVVFHFYDDFSKPNLRFKEMMLRGKGEDKFCHPTDMELPWILSEPKLWHHQTKTFMTWAPSHIELALLSELLHYVNLIDGLSKTERRELRNSLEFLFGAEDEDIYLAEKNLLEFARKVRNKRSLIGYERTKEGRKRIISCFEICPEYIEWLKETLKAYMK
jgi:hypothetical protein